MDPERSIHYPQNISRNIVKRGSGDNSIDPPFSNRECTEEQKIDPLQTIMSLMCSET